MFLELELAEDQWKLIERKALANSRTIPAEIARRLEVKILDMKWRAKKDKKGGEK